jgi:hypothetical protein
MGALACRPSSFFGYDSQPLAKLFRSESIRLRCHSARRPATAHCPCHCHGASNAFGQHANILLNHRAFVAKARSNHRRRVGGVVTQRIANPCTGVRFSYSPPTSCVYKLKYPQNSQDVVNPLLYTTRTQSALSFRSEFDSFQTSVC